jgi:hypothetical protein
VKPAESSSSCAAFLKYTYLRLTSMFSKPVNVLPPSGARMSHAPARDTPRFGDRRFENSPLRLVNLVAGDSPDAGSLMWKIVGKDSSSATNGSSVASVAGRNRSPIIPCASADAVLPTSAARIHNDTAHCLTSMKTPMASSPTGMRAGTNARPSERWTVVLDEGV